MSKSNLNTLVRLGIACIYVRLSRDDDLEGESYSISNQKKLLLKIAKDYGYTDIKIFCDDGVSGVTMNRPEFNKMIKLIETGKVSAVFVKDLSRLGRNYIEVGRLIEDFLPEHSVRLVAVSDNIDSDEGDNEFAPIKNLFNEWYARDISKKRRISNKIRGSAGMPLSPPPYGYMKTPDDPYHWTIDVEVAPVVRRIHILYYNGMGPLQIANILTDEKILTPLEYLARKGIKRAGNRQHPNPYQWGHSTILKILSTQEYCGDIINFKTYSISYKKKQRFANKPEDMMVFKDVNPAIIERELFEANLERRNNEKKGTRSRNNKDGERNIFCGLLLCGDGGRNLNYHFHQKNNSIKYFNCPNYNSGKRKTCFSSHHIRVDFLEEVVLGEIRRLTRFATRYEDQFTKLVADYSETVYQAKKESRTQQLETLKKRDKELDKLFESIYEDNVSGKLSDERFKKMAAKYEEEQKEISELICKLQAEIEADESKHSTIDSFISTVKKYTRVKKLNPVMLNELIDHIEVYTIEKVDGVNIQRLKIHYKFIGTVDLPDIAPLPNIEVPMRKGVTVNYMPAPSI